MKTLHHLFQHIQPKLSWSPSRPAKALCIGAIALAAATTVAQPQKTETLYLSGTGKDHTVDWEFFCTAGMNSGKWTSIAVPSNWEQQGFGAYNYGYDSPVDRASEKGLYMHTFNVPANWKGNTVYIVFEGSMTDTEVKINGKSAGPVHQGAFYRFRYNVGPLLKYGQKNLLEVTVSKVSSNTSVNKAEREADFWVFGGIYRPVYLQSLPKSHIANVAIDAQANGVFKAKIGLPARHSANKLLVELYDAAKTKVGETVISQLAQGITETWATVEIEAPKRWTPETPHLYSAKITLYKTDQVLHTVSQTFGFRTVEIRERDGVYLNGVKIKFKGVNRHSFWPTSGRTTNKEISIKDANLIKDMNMNAVRNSHYPADEHFYAVCDSLGLMVLDELCGWHDAYDTPTGCKLVAEMMDVSRNHPCVVMWVNGNEGGHNRELLPWYAQLDVQKRPVVQAWEIFNGTDTQHYRDYNYGVGNHFQGHDVVFPTEFLHGVYDGGHGAGLEDFWKLMWGNPLSAGGFLWNFADEGVARTDRNGQIDTDGNHGADGIVGPFHEKEGSFFTIKEVWAPIYFDKREITDRFDGKFVLENRYHFTNTDQCKFVWELASTALPYQPAPLQSVKGTAQSPSIAPLQKDTFKLNLPQNWKEFDILYVTAYEPSGREIFTWSWPISLPGRIADRLVDKTGGSAPSVSDNGTHVTVKTADVTVSFDKATGLLARAANAKGPIPLTNGPVLCEGTARFKSLAYRTEGNNVVVESLFDDKSNLNKAVWTMFPGGWLEMYVEYSPDTEQSVLLGVNFNCDENTIKSMQWMGDGPYRVWKNRIKGNTLGVWSKQYNTTVTGQPPLEYPEFKGYHSRMYWLTVNTSAQPFTVVCPDEDLFFRMLTPDWPKHSFNTNPPFPEGQISFMHGISAMGTKQFTPERMGPMSQKNIYYHYERQRPLKMRLYFDFRSK